ncbi:MAG TPA: hypothetical protein VFV38_16285 [Ktedonobacteraceae bacterium]|nr:hypothetical protein [Ktedonobacteraceae bacterium]
MKSRFSVMIMVASIIIIIILLLRLGASRMNSMSSVGQQAVTLVGAIFALFGIIFLLIMLHAYFYIHRSRQFTFEGIGNESGIAQVANKPINMTKLAREELTKQFREIYDELRLCIMRYEKSDYNYHDFSLVAREHKQGSPKYQRADLTEYLVSYGEDEHTLSIRSIRKAIKQIVNIDPGHIMGYTLQEIGAGVPQPFQPLTKFVDALVPPNTIKAVAYLQWQGTCSTQSIGEEQKGLAGITLELEDLGQKRRSRIYTLWQSVSKEQKVLYLLAIHKDNHKEIALNCYIQLLRPTMRWLVLLFWESYLFDELGKHKESAELFYILGALYLYSAKQFEEYKDIFLKCARECLQQAIQIKPEWFILKKRLGFICSLLAEGNQERDKKEQWIRDGLQLYDEALQLAQETEEEQDVQNHIKSLQLYLKLQLDDPQIHLEAKREYEIWVRSHSPTQFDTTKPDLAGLYSYNLASCCIQFHQKNPHPSLLREARRYLAYGLARSQRTWLVVDDDLDFKAIREDKGFGKLMKKLEKQRGYEKQKDLPVEDTLSYLQGEVFKHKIDNILYECGWA